MAHLPLFPVTGLIFLVLGITTVGIVEYIQKRRKDAQIRRDWTR